MKQSIEVVFLAYFLLSQLIYMLLNILSLHSLGYHRTRQRLQDRALQRLMAGHQLPSINIIVPAYNEQNVIHEAIRSLLNTHYPRFCITIVNDGSTDGTLELLKKTYQLVPSIASQQRTAQRLTPHGQVKNHYQSALYPHLTVIDKINGGKADALNAGLESVCTDLVCCVDADSLLEPHSLLVLVRSYLKDPKNTLAVGGTVRIGNGGIVSNGMMVKPQVPKNLLASLQIIEYVRSFLLTRVGWSRLNSLLIVSGAFGLFKRQSLMEMGGYRAHLMGEDMELVVRLHLHHKNEIPYRILHVPEAICWTEVPQSLRDLKKQRIRWQRGLLESLVLNRKLCFAQKSGLVGWLAFPFSLLFEGLDPLIEVVGILFCVVASLSGGLPWMETLCIVGLSLSSGFFLSVVALCAEEFAFQTYPGFKNLVRFLFLCVIETCFYRKLSSLWRLQGTLSWFFRKKQQWGLLARRGWY